MSFSAHSIFEDGYFAFGVTSFIGIVLGLAFRKIFDVKKNNKIQKQTDKYDRYPRSFYGTIESMHKNSFNRKNFQSLSEPSQYRLSLVIPAYNEEKRLEFMLKEVMIVLEFKIKADQKYNCEIILVDDGSKDGTVLEYRRIVTTFKQNPRIHFKLLKLSKNSGKGRAVCEGFLASLGENILFADADGSTDFESLNKFEDLIKRGKDDILICGSRCHLRADDESIVKRSLFRLILMKVFHLYISIFGVRSVSDTQCGFKMLNRSAARKILPWIHITGWIFDVEIILLAEKKGVQIHEVPVNWKEMNGTKLQIALDSIKMAKDLLRIRLNYFFGIWTSQ